MSQAVAALLRNLIFIFLCSGLLACNGSYTAFESDRTFNTDVKTGDIKQENAELIMLSVYQSSLLAHLNSPVYKFLDASDLPAIECSEGTASYTYPRNSGEIHKTGDRISVSFSDCVKDGFIYNGRMTGTYSNIKGLNKRFINLTNDQCIASLQEKHSLSADSITRYVYETDNEVFQQDDLYISLGTEIDVTRSGVITATGDDIRFSRVGNQYKVDILFYEYRDLTSGGVEKLVTAALTFTVSENYKVVFVVEPRNALPEQVASVDGAIFHSIVKLVEEKENCQGFERQLDVQFTDFSVEEVDYLKTTLNGSVKLEEAQQDPNRLNQSFVSSSFSTTVTQGYVTETFYMKDYSVEKAINIAEDSYSYKFDGLVSNQAIFGGTLLLTPLDRLLGNISNKYPRAGALEIKAKDLERIYAVPDNSSIELRVDYNGDSTGNGFSDIDIYINTTWERLFNRDFKE